VNSGLAIGKENRQRVLQQRPVRGPW